MKKRNDSKSEPLTCLCSLLLLGAVGYALILFVRSTHATGYSSYNTQIAYPFASFPHFVSMLGGVHYADVMIPLACFSFFLWRLMSKDNSKENNSNAEENKPEDKYYNWLLKFVFGMFTLILPLRIIYGMAFLVNSFSFSGEQTVESVILLSHEYHYQVRGSGHTSSNYVLVVEVDDEVPYELPTTHRNHLLFKCKGIKKVRMTVEQGLLGFSRVKNYEIIE